MIIPKFKIHCSAFGQLLTEPKTKAAKEAGELSETVKNYAILWLKDQIYQRKSTFTSKYTDKGNICEQEGIDRYNKHAGIFATKNQETFENEWAIGTPDISYGSEIIDIKNAYTHKTFPMFEPAKDDYIEQVKGYLWIVPGAKTGKVVYVLENMPMELAEKECIKQGIDFTCEIYEQDFCYDHVPDNLRIKIFEVLPDVDLQNKIILQVEKIRHFLSKLSW